MNGDVLVATKRPMVVLSRYDEQVPPGRIEPIRRYPKLGCRQKLKRIAISLC